MIVTLTATAKHLCPYRDEIDYGTAEVIFNVDDENGDAPEIHATSAILFHLEDQRISHEDFTRTLLNATHADRVVTRWTTAGMAVSCDLSREPVRA